MSEFSWSNLVVTACNKRQVDTQMSSTTVQRFIDNHYMSNLLTNTLAVLHRLAVSLLGGLGRLSGIGLALLDELDEPTNHEIKHQTLAKHYSDHI